MKRVILCGSGAIENLAGNPVLRREGLEVITCPDIARTFLEVKKAGADLLLWEQTGDLDESSLFHSRLAQVVDPGKTTAICIWHDAVPPGLPEFVTKNLSSPPDQGELESLIAESLGMSPRTARRYLVRLSLHVQDKSFSCLCNSVDISRTGVFIEAPKPLKLDGLYDLTLMGQPGNGVPTLKVRVLREKESRPGFGWKFYGAVFEDVPHEDIERMAKVLGLRD